MDERTNPHLREPRSLTTESVAFIDQNLRKVHFHAQIFPHTRDKKGKRTFAGELRLENADVEEGKLIVQS